LASSFARFSTGRRLLVFLLAKFTFHLLVSQVRKVKHRLTFLKNKNNKGEGRRR
jgi:hypothetical protein